MPKTPDVPAEPVSFTEDVGTDASAPTLDDRQDHRARALSGQSGYPEASRQQQGQFGNLKPDLMTHWKVQDRRGV